MKVKRIIYCVPGFFKALAQLTNNEARSYEAKRRFSKSIIDEGVCTNDNVVIGKKSHILSGCIINDSKIGSFTYVGQDSIIQNTTIGNYCSISRDLICGLGAHPLDSFSTSPLFYRRKNTFGIQVVKEDADFIEYKHVSIGNDVWIGARATILDGITIGNGAVIASGAVVTHDIPPYAIVGGVPAKVIRFRATEDRIREYTESEWWGMEPEDAYKKMRGI